MPNLLDCLVPIHFRHRNVHADQIVSSAIVQGQAESLHRFPAVDGNMTLNPQDAYALASGMIVIILVTITIYSVLQRRTSRWLR